MIFFIWRKNNVSFSRYLQSVKKYSGATKATFKISKAKTLTPSPLNQCCESKERQKNQKLHMFWQQATLIKGERRFVPLIFWLIVGLCVFVKSTDFKICDVIISIATPWKLHLCLLLLNLKSYKNETWSNTSMLSDKYF